MLAAIGVSSVEELFREIPAGVRFGRELAVAPALSEAELTRHLEELAAKNVIDEVSFLGAGIYDHYVPAVVDAVLQRGEFLTAYTPYQPELSQGVLQAIFEYQTAICELTGMDVSNASGYDGTTVAADACFVAKSATGREPRGRHRGDEPPGARGRAHVLARASASRSSRCRTRAGSTDPDAVREAARDAAAVIFQQPNFFGCLEPAPDLAAAANDAGALPIAHVDLISLGVLEAPGNYGCALAIGEGQSAGNYMSYGGPHYGFLAARDPYIRRLPGRIVGETVDAAGKRGYVLTLQTREQHIRREKATSNITTNQTLLALAGLVHLSLLGPEGLRETGETCMALAAYAKRAARGERSSAAVPGADNVQGVCRRRRTERRRGDPRRPRARRQPRLPARPRLPRARERPPRRSDREANGRGDRPAAPRPLGAASWLDVKLIYEKSKAGPPRARASAARTSGAGCPAGAGAQGAAAPARARRAGGAPPLHRALDAELRRRHRLLPARLLHDEVQPARQRADRRATRLPRPASARRRRRRAGRSRARVAARGDPARSDGPRRRQPPAGRRIAGRADRPAGHALALREHGRGRPAARS